MSYNARDTLERYFKEYLQVSITFNIYMYDAAEGFVTVWFKTVVALVT